MARFLKMISTFNWPFQLVVCSEFESVSVCLMSNENYVRLVYLCTQVTDANTICPCTRCKLVQISVTIVFCQWWAFLQNNWQTGEIDVYMYMWSTESRITHCCLIQFDLFNCVFVCVANKFSYLLFIHFVLLPPRCPNLFQTQL